MSEFAKFRFRLATPRPIRFHPYRVTSPRRNVSLRYLRFRTARDRRKSAAIIAQTDRGRFDILRGTFGTASAPFRVLLPRLRFLDAFSQKNTQQKQRGSFRRRDQR